MADLSPSVIPFWFLCAISRKKKGEISLKQDKKMIVCFLTPLMVFFVGLYVYPIIRTIVMSFYQVEAISDPVSTWKFVGPENFKVLLNTSIFRQSMMNMIKIWLMGGIIVMFFAILFAVILTSGVKFKNFYRAVIYIPNIINAVAISTMWINFVYNKRFGLLHTFFKWIGADDLAKMDYMNGNAKFHSLLVAFCFGSVGCFMLILYTGMALPYTTTFLTAFFANQSVVYGEAAAIDGASPMKTFWTIMFPLAQPGLVTVSIFNFMNVWNEYFLSMIFASSQKSMTVGPGLKSVLTAMQYTGDWGGLFAAVVIVFLPTLLIFVCLSRTIINGIAAGGIKG